MNREKLKQLISTLEEVKYQYTELLEAIEAEKHPDENAAGSLEEALEAVEDAIDSTWDALGQE